MIEFLSAVLALVLIIGGTTFVQVNAEKLSEQSQSKIEPVDFPPAEAEFNFDVAQEAIKVVNKPASPPPSSGQFPPADTNLTKAFNNVGERTIATVAAQAVNRSPVLETCEGSCPNPSPLAAPSSSPRPAFLSIPQAIPLHLNCPVSSDNPGDPEVNLNIQAPECQLPI